MTNARANRINVIVFVTVVTYIAVVCIAVSMGDRGVMVAAAQALVVIPFAMIAAAFGAVILAYLVAAAFGALALIGMLCFLLIGKKSAALRLSETVNAAETRVANKILPPKDQDD